ncbi:unnamed protein product [Eruca vesicaria subsp. sativa]|uniref:Uncharacterized protein n=1 Tax=Eruca vesicaria subsp. sativa TaxID=29727 RepID=A0ABC8JSP3_ERUVS|nr:unnamed protein product [Eruca vesicaria subsp. sativa]
MEGEAMLWFQWRQSLWLFNSWEALKKSLWLRSVEDPENIKYNTETQRSLEQLQSLRPWNESKVKGVSECSSTHPQVTIPLGIDDLKTESLGYRSSVEVNQIGDGKVKNSELPNFDGFMPYGWICRV